MTVAVSAWASPPAEQAKDAERRALAVASYQGGAVTVGEIEDTIADSSPLIQATALEPESLRGFLERNLRFELELQEAERRGYRDKPEIQKTSRENAVKLMLSRDIDAPLRADPPSPDTVRAYFESHRDVFTVHEKRRASALFLASEADARALLPQVKAADDKALRELVRARGLDVPSKAKGGALGSFDAKGTPESGDAPIAPEIANTVFALPELGAVSDVIKVADKFVILKLTEIRAGHVPTFEEVRVRVARRYDDDRYDKAVQAITDAQRAQLKPVVHEELIEQVRIE